LISPLSAPSFPFEFNTPFGIAAMVFFAFFLLGLLDRLSLPSSPLLTTVEEVDMADGGRGGTFVGGGMAMEAEEAARLIVGALEIVGRRDMLAVVEM